MKNLVNEKINLFIRGSFAGGIAGGTFMFGSTLLGYSLILEFPIKLFGTIVIAFCSGIATVAANDLYKHKIKPWAFKILGIKEKEDLTDKTE